MNDDAPWLNLSEKEIQELKQKKWELTDYGKKRIRELLNKEKLNDD